MELIEGLEETKRIATDIEARSALAKETQVKGHSMLILILLVPCELWLPKPYALFASQSGLFLCVSLVNMGSGQHSSHERKVPPGGEQVIATVLPHERFGQDPLLLHLLAGGFH